MSECYSCGRDAPIVNVMPLGEELCVECDDHFGDDPPTSEYACRECGARTDAQYFMHVATRLRRLQICMSCDHWLGLIAKKDDRSVVVNGCHYRIGDEPTAEQFRKTMGWGFGYSGARFTIRFSDGRIVATRNLWCQGDIPERFRTRLPDNAEFATPEISLR